MRCLPLALVLVSACAAVNDDFDQDGVEDGRDCAPEDASRFPGAAEILNDGVDQDCDGVDGHDIDGDGFASDVAPRDCNDSDVLVYPGADEDCGDGLDNDCDGVADLADSDCAVGDDDSAGDDDTSGDDDSAGDDDSGGDDDDDDDPGDDDSAGDADGDGFTSDDCDDGDPAVNPGATEVCNGVDDDCDGDVDVLASGSLGFDGTDDVVWLPNESAFDLSTSATFEAWVWSSTPQGDDPVFVKEEAQGGNLQFWFGVKNGGFGLMLGSGGTWELVQRTSGTVPLEQWTHLASSWDGATWTNYQDGVAVDSGSFSGSVGPGAALLSIAQNGVKDSAHFAGRLYDVRIWSVGRSAIEIADGRYGLSSTAGLVSRWMMDDGTGQILTDASVNTLHGELGGASGVDAEDPVWVAEPVVCQ